MESSALAGEEIGRFATLVRRQCPKLDASQLTKLPPHLYKDYLQKVKLLAPARPKQHG